MSHILRFVVSSAILLGVLFVPNLQAQTRVTLVKKGDAFELMANGKPYDIKGVGGETRLAELKAAGGNTVRTWASDKLGPILDEAQKNGLMVCAGLWMGHQRHGFNYGNATSVKRQLQQKLSYVRKHKDHPALLMWGVGNEMEGEGNDPAVWKAVNELAREIKSIDSNHPTMTVIAEVGDNAFKVAHIDRYCPDIDIVGINAYGGIDTVGKRYRAGGGSKPYVITEHGPLGPWEVEKTPWGAPVEWSSTQKGDFYSRGYRVNAIDGAAKCLGTFAFLWGDKQETTATWFGMLLPDGTRLAAVDAMTEAWKGKAPANRCPRIDSFKVDRDRNIELGQPITATLSTSDPESDKLAIKWVLRVDSVTIGAGGDPQAAQRSVADAVKADGTTAKVTLTAHGAYRLFAYVSDGKGGAAVANIPLQAPKTTSLASSMPAAKLPYVVYGDEALKNNVYIPSGYMGNAGAVTMTPNCKENPFAGPTCLKAEYKSNADWGGVLWQSPAEDWDGKQPGGANLTGATHLEFYARGAKGGEVVNFVFGVLNGNQPYPDTGKGELNNLKLTSEWKKYQISLKDMDLRQIKTGFGWSLAGQGKPVTFYMDDIKYVKR